MFVYCSYLVRTFGSLNLKSVEVNPNYLGLVCHRHFAPEFTVFEVLKFWFACEFEFSGLKSEPRISLLQFAFENFKGLAAGFSNFHWFGWGVVVLLVSEDVFLVLFFE